MQKRPSMLASAWYSGSRSWERSAASAYMTSHKSSFWFFSGKRFRMARMRSFHSSGSATIESDITVGEVVTPRFACERPYSILSTTMESIQNAVSG